MFVGAWDFIGAALERIELQGRCNGERDARPEDLRRGPRDARQQSNKHMQQTGRSCHSPCDAHGHVPIHVPQLMCDVLSLVE